MWLLEKPSADLVSMIAVTLETSNFEGAQALKLATRNALSKIAIADRLIFLLSVSILLRITYVP
jgi:hypothetical protein